MISFGSYAISLRRTVFTASPETRAGPIQAGHIQATAGVPNATGIIFGQAPYRLWAVFQAVAFVLPSAANPISALGADKCVIIPT